MSDRSRFEEAHIGAVLDRRYMLRREIARGGMGCVFEADHVITRARVALKVLRKPALESDNSHARLMREARVLGVLRHPSIVSIHDAGCCERYGPFIALEMIEGRPLDGILISRQTLPVGQTIALAMQLCEALENVHQHGFVHRDVKPSNVLISRTLVGDQVELIDFGVAKVGPEVDEVDEKLTKAGELLGTVEYMSPEQIMGRPIDARTDVYGVGILLYECLTGEVPYSGRAINVISNMLAGTRPHPIGAKRSDVPLELEAVVRQALEIDPAKRFVSTRALGVACAGALAGLVPALDILGVGDDRAGGLSEFLSARASREAAQTVSETPNRRRQFPRAPYVTPVRILLEGGATCDGRTEDLSEGGALVVTDDECARDVAVQLRIPMPTTGRVVLLAGITKWIKTRRNQRAIGVEFQDPPEEVRAEIRRYVSLLLG